MITVARRWGTRRGRSVRGWRGGGLHGLLPSQGEFCGERAFHPYCDSYCVTTSRLIGAEDGRLVGVSPFPSRRKLLQYHVKTLLCLNICLEARICAENGRNSAHRLAKVITCTGLSSFTPLSEFQFVLVSSHHIPIQAIPLALYPASSSSPRNLLPPS